MASERQGQQTLRRLFHYTNGHALRSIVDDELIKPASIGVDARIERPVVWLTYGEEWEPTAARALLKNRKTGEVVDLTFEQVGSVGKGFFRIEVDTSRCRLMPWSRFRENSGVQPKVAADLWRTAIGKGSDPRLWRMTFDAIPMESWITIEILSPQQRVWGTLEPFVSQFLKSRPTE